MKRKILCVLSSLLLTICLCFVPFNSAAASPEATLSIDGGTPVPYPSVQAAVDAVAAAPSGTDFVIEIAEGTVDEVLNILQQPDKNVVIKPQPGATVTFTNTIVIDGNGNLLGSDTLLIQGLNFDLSSGTPENCIDFTHVPSKIGNVYPHNITINGCTFKGVFDKTVAVQSDGGGSRNIAIMNCTADTMHSLAQPKAVSGYMFVQNCTLTNSSGGVNFYGIGDLTIDSCNFNVEEYAVRSGQSSGAEQTVGSVNINNSVLNSKSPTVGTVVLRVTSTDNINIIHSDLTNTSGGPVLQNLNTTKPDRYKIDVVESNLDGQIADINTATITTIDDPNVENGPVCINVNPDNGSVPITPVVVVMLVATFIILALILVLAVYLTTTP